MSDAASRICALADDVFEVEPGTVSLASTPNDIESWDSLAMLSLLVALEDEFGVLISPDDIAETADIGSIVALVESRVSG